MLSDNFPYYNYPSFQINAQRIFGPPLDWVGNTPGFGTEVYVAKIPPDVFNEELISMFAAAGRIYQLRLIMHFSGLTKGFGYVRYSSRDEAETAIRILNGKEVRPGLKLVVTLSMDNKKLIIQGIPRHLSPLEVRSEIHFKIPTAIQVFVPRDHAGGNKGHVIVEFNSHKDAANVRQKFNCNFMIFGQNLFISWNTVKSNNPTRHFQNTSTRPSLWVCNLSRTTSKAAIKALFDRVIAPNKVAFINIQNKVARVSFYCERDSDLALQACNNVILNGSCIQLYPANDGGEGSGVTSSIPQEPMEPNSMEVTKALLTITNFTTIDDIASLIILKFICFSFCWSMPIYNIMETTNVHTNNVKVWDASILINRVGKPLFLENSKFGPFQAQIHCSSEEEAKIQMASRTILVFKNYVMIASTTSSYLSEQRLQHYLEAQSPASIWSNSPTTDILPLTANLSNLL